MKFFRIVLINIIILFIFKTTFSQGVPIGEWRDHLPYNKVIEVVEADNRIYAATPYCLFYFDKSDNSVHRFTKVTGLSDVNITATHYNKDNNIASIYHLKR